MKTIKQTILLCVLWIIGIGAYANQIVYTASAKLQEVTSPGSGLYKYGFDVEISSHTFSNGTGYITFSGNVTKIDNKAFRRCYGLTSIEIPNSVISIGNEAFRDCTNLSNIEIPNSVASIEYDAFNGCM